MRLLPAGKAGRSSPPQRKGPGLPDPDTSDLSDTSPALPSLTFPWGKCFTAVIVQLCWGPDEFVPARGAAVLAFCCSLFPQLLCLSFWGLSSLAVARARRATWLCTPRVWLTPW